MEVTLTTKGNTLSTNAFNPYTLEVPRPEDLRRAIECMILYRREDASGVAMVLAEAETQGRTSFTIAAILFLASQFADQASAEHNFDVEANLRHLQAALAVSEDEERDD